jgi:acyl carrier protein
VCFVTVLLPVLLIQPNLKIKRIKDKIMSELVEELKVKLIEILNLTDVKPEDFHADDQLVGGELGIDSIDVLEMVVMVEKDYGIIVNNQEVGEKVFSSITNLADYIKANSPKASS